MKYTTLSDDDMDVVQKFAFGGIANPIQRPFLRSADKEFLAARQAELDAFEQQRQAYNTGLAKYQEEVYKPYQQQAEAYNAAAKQYNTEVYEPYQQQFNAYEKAVSDFNAGDRTSDYAGPAEPTLARAFEMQAPTTPGSFDMTAPVLPFKEEDVVARQQQAAQTARKDAGNRATAINVVSNPEQFGFGSMSVSNRFMAEGGPVDKDTGPSARDMLDGMSGSDDGKMDRVVRELSAKGKMSEEAIMDAVTRVSNAGRGGDELLAYLSPESMAFLKSQGGSGTVNPETGLPEFFIKSLIKAVQRAFGGGGSAPAPAPQAPPPPPTAAEQLAALQKSVDGLQSQLKETPETIRVRRGFRKRTVENPAFAQLNSQLTTARGQLDEFMKTYKPEPAPAAPAPLPMSTAATAPTAPTAQQIANTPGMGTGGIGVNVQPLPMSTAATTPTVTRQQPLPPAPNPEALFNPPPPAFVGPVQQTPAAPPPPPPPVVRDPRAISGPAGGAASQTTVGPNAAALLSSINAARPLAAVELGRAVPGTTRPATGGQPTAPGAPPQQSGGLDTSYQPGAVAQPQFVDYSSRGVGSVGNVGTAQQNLSMPMFNDFQRSQAMQATRPSNYFAQSQPGTLGNTPGTTAIGSGNAPLPMAFNTMNAIDANRNLSPGMLGGMQNAGVMTDRLGNRIFSPGMVPGFAKGGLAEAADVEEDDRPINTDPLGSAQQYMAQLTDANKPSPTRQSVKRLAKNTGGASAPKGMGMSTEPLASAKDLVPQLSDKGSSRQQMEELARVYQLKINAAKNKARGLAADTFGAPTLEGPALTKNTLAKKRFAKGGEAKKSDAVEEGENLSSQQETAKGGFFGGLFGGSKEDPLKGIKKTAEKNKDYRAILEYLKSRDAVPEIKSGYLPDPIDAVFSSVNLPLVGAVGKGQIKINKEIRGPDYETFLGPSTLAHEMTHAADRQLQEQAGEQSGMFSKGNQFTDAYEKMVGSGGMREGKKRTELARKYYPKFVSGNRDYRAAPHEIAAHGVGKYAGPTTADNAPPHVDATAATEFQILLDLARRNSGAPVTELKNKPRR